MTQTPTLTEPIVYAPPVYEITEEDKRRQVRIARAWDAYNGNLAPPLDKTPEGLDPNVMSNRCVGVVDGGVNFLFGKEIEISAEEGSPASAQAQLDTTWGRKEKRIPLLQKIAMNGAMAGSPFVRIVPNKKGSVRLVALDPATVCVQTAPQDCETVLLWCIEYCTHQTINGKPERVYYREEIARIDPDGNALQDMPDDDDTWSIQHWTRVGEKAEWEAAGAPIIWDYPFAPIFGCQNLPNPNDYWGRPDITDDIIGMNESLNLTQSCINLVQVLYGQPVLYANGVGSQVIDLHPGHIIGLETPDGKISAVTIPSDTANALAFADSIRSDIDEQSAVPGVAMGRISAMPRGALSGVAIELFFQPLLQKTETKRCLYGELIIDVSKAVMTLAKMDGENIDITIAWQNPLPKDDLQSIQASILLKEIGVSNTTIQRNEGFDPEEELRLSQSEDEQQLIASTRGQGLPPAQQGVAPFPGQPPAVVPGQPQPAQQPQYLGMANSGQGGQQ
jgi:hypothetical protein